MRPPTDTFGRHGERFGRVAEGPDPPNTYAKAWRAGLDRQRFSFARRNRDIEIGRVGRNALDRPGLSPEMAAHQPNMRAVVVGDLGDVGGLDFLVAGLRHLERRGQIGPQLESVHPAGRIALRHFLMDDAAARGHPLDVAGGDGAAVAEAVAVLHRSGEHIRDGLDAAMGMPREAREVVLRHIVAKVVEQQERVVVGRLAESERPAQVHACAFQRGLGCDELLDGSK